MYVSLVRFPRSHYTGSTVVFALCMSQQFSQGVSVRFIEFDVIFTLGT